MKITLAMGLPASGKTTLLKEKYFKSEKTKTKYLSIDKLKKDDIQKEIAELSTKKEELIIDGLFLKNIDIAQIINMVAEYVIQDIDVMIYHFEDNRMKCLNNDLGRRKEASTITIINAEYEDIDIEDIKKNLSRKVKNKVKNIEYEELQIFKKKKYQIFCDQNAVGKVIRSNHWAIYGNYCDCWGDSTEVIPEKPVFFKELDEVLRANCRTLTDEEYDEIFNNCVSIQTEEEHDYYGGSVTYEFFICDMESLYNKLINMNLLERNEQYASKNDR